MRRQRSSRSGVRSRIYWRAFAVYLVHKKAGVILGVLAIIVGASRVLAHVHHPIDIIGSLAIAGVAVLIAHYIIPKIPDKYLDFKHYFKK